MLADMITLLSFAFYYPYPNNFKVQMLKYNVNVYIVKSERKSVHKLLPDFILVA